MIIVIAVIVGLTVIKWLVYTALLWGMIKIQKMQYNVAGLFGASALAILLGFIPVVGCYVSWVALVLCLNKVTRADIVPDVLFTVAIAGALMFCLNLWAFTALMGELRPDLRTASSKDEPALEETMDEDDLLDEAAEAAPAGKAGSGPASKTATAAAAKPVSNTQVTPATYSDYGLALKGVVLNSKQSMAMISGPNGKVYTVAQGDALTIPTPKVALRVRCNTIEKSAVSLTVNDEQEVILRVY